MTSCCGIWSVGKGSVLHLNSGVVSHSTTQFCLLLQVECTVLMMLLIRKTLSDSAETDKTSKSSDNYCSLLWRMRRPGLNCRGGHKLTTFTHQLWLNGELLKLLYFGTSIFGPIVYYIYQSVHHILNTFGATFQCCNEMLSTCLCFSSLGFGSQTLRRYGRLQRSPKITKKGSRCFISNWRMRQYVITLTEKASETFAHRFLSRRVWLAPAVSGGHKWQASSFPP